MVHFIVGIIVGIFLMSAIIAIIYCFSVDNDVFEDRLLIVLKISYILIVITALGYTVYTTVSML